MVLLFARTLFILASATVLTVSSVTAFSQSQLIDSPDTLPLQADSGVFQNYQKISNSTGNLNASALAESQFGFAAAGLGDLDGDGVGDMAVGVRLDDDGGNNRGAVYILFLNGDGTVKTSQKISATQAEFSGVLEDGDLFGCSVANLGDTDGDGLLSIAVGACGGDNDEGVRDVGVVYLLELNANGTVDSYNKLSDSSEGFAFSLDRGDQFGQSLATLGDLDQDGVSDIAVGAYYDDDGGTDRGAVYILFLNEDNTLKSSQKISDTRGNFTAILNDSDRFAKALSTIGDVNGDGIQDLAISADRDDDGGTDRGAVYILLLNRDGTVQDHRKINSLLPNFNDALGNGDYFGFSLVTLGDITGDGIEDLAVGAYQDDDGGSNRGALYILELDAQSEVVTYQKISNALTAFSTELNNADYFGNSVAALGDINQDGVGDIAVGAFGDDDGGSFTGAMYVFFLNSQVKENQAPVIDNSVMNFAIPENSTGTVATVNATNPDMGTLNGGDTLTLAVAGGVDESLFQVDSVTGELSFVTPPDYENPEDNDRDNIYSVEVAATDNGTPVLSASDTFTFTVTDVVEEDADGIAESVELAAPNRGDGNNDGIQDNLQSDVASLPTTDGSYLTLDGNGCQLSNVTVVEEVELASQDPAYDYPNGLVDFTGDCTLLELEAFLYTDENRILRKYTGVYDTVTAADIATITIDSQDVLKFEYQVMDGDSLDTTPAGDGLIQDPVGFAVLVSVQEEPEVNQETPEPETNTPQSDGPDTLIRTGGW